MIKSPPWTVPVDHPAFAGHFPGTPIIPGVLLLDLALRTIAAASGIALATCTLSSIKFLSPAGPGDTVVIEHQLTASSAIRFEILATAATTPTRRIIASGSIVAELSR